MGHDKVKHCPAALKASIPDINAIHADGVKVGRLAALKEVREATGGKVVSA